ncbi:sulfite exporter TauE/SafE family protein [Emticicia sp. TH156]|uniref:sulfite exporter TauE/SafE family protein n=1 Tax=Emticicia sp. TH156 TaxID=2067454 RepID=UPI000C75C26F|nr:sulfite exporter TauE/SafE family protein [Emticicia sp. TH156]PLK46371.1 permease [Emticicia sp. TH156]
MEIVGFGLAFLIGITLGLIGAGGSILTVTVLVYIMGVSPSTATTYSLFIVGITSLVGSVDYFRKGLVDIRKGLFFSFPAFVMVFIMRKYVMPRIPEVIYQSDHFTLSKNLMVMLLFGLLMIGASYSTIKSRKKDNEIVKTKVSYWVIFLEGILVGILTGLVGAGGGFMIIPALVIFAQLPMKEAVGTSLLIITINSMFGAIGDFSAGVVLDYRFISEFVLCTVAGVLVGSYLSKRIDGEKLKPAFGWFILIIGCWIIVKETLLK